MRKQKTRKDTIRLCESIAGLKIGKRSEKAVAGRLAHKRVYVARCGPVS